MNIQSYNQKGKIIKKFKGKQYWAHIPKNERNFKLNPYMEIYLEDTPKKKTTTTIKLTFSELEKIIK